MSNPELTDDEWSAWVADKTEAVLGAACAELGTDHPDYGSVLNAIGDTLMMESKRGAAHLRPVD